MDGTEDDILWDSESSSQESEEYDVPAGWDTDINLTQEEFKQLFSESYDKSDFEGS